MISVESLVDKHKGSVGFVVGAGPSLHHVNTDLLRDYVTVSVNSALPKVKFCDYFLADDIGVKHWNYYQEVLPRNAIASPCCSKGSSATRRLILTPSGSAGSSIRAGTVPRQRLMIQKGWSLRRASRL
jgi:hypothetical protein